MESLASARSARSPKASRNLRFRIRSSGRAPRSPVSIHLRHDAPQQKANLLSGPLLFFDTVKLHEKPELHLKELHSKFSIVASSFAVNSQDPSSPSHFKLFYDDIDGTTHSPKDSDQSDFAWLTDSMAEFVEAKTKLFVGQIMRLPIFTSKKLALIAI